MRILLFGKGGQVGRELQRSLAVLGEVVALGSSGEPWPSDFRHPEALRETVRVLKPQVIVNSAAYTAVDRAEADVDAARTVNATAPRILAEAAQACGAWLVHYSTDYVFDGSGSRPWSEEDAPAPLNVYGQTKLEGEQAVRSLCSRHLVFRTSWVYARHGGNFIRTVLRLAAEREALRLVDDQIGAPTGADLIADVTAHALRQALLEPHLAGLYHLSASGETSWFAYARYLLDETRRQSEVARKMKVRTMEPIPSSAYPTPARRPLNSRLDTRRLQSAFGLCLPPWQQGVARVVEDLLQAPEWVRA